MSTPTAEPPMLPAAAPDKKPPVKFGSQKGMTAFHGLDIPGLVKFLRLRPPMDWNHWFRITTLFLNAPLQSFWNTLEWALYGRAVARTELIAPPVFVIGHWRSGTTLLQNLMVLDDQMVTPNLAEVMFPQGFLLAEPLVCPWTNWIPPTSRPMDNLPVGWREPQEDEIALLTMTLVSPYLMLAFQNDTEVYQRFYRTQTMTPAERDLWKSKFITYLKRMTYKYRRRILLKSPTHTWRIPAFLEMFPGCKFIYIHRHPYSIYPSSMHLRKTMYPENTLGTVDHTRDPEEVLKLYMDCFNVYEQDRHLIPPGDLHEIRFEDLEQDPYAEMQKLYEGLSLPGWDKLDPRLREEVPKLRQFKKNQFNLDDATVARIYPFCKPIFDRFGYDPHVSSSRSA